MPTTKQELSLLVNPLVPESVQHNNRVLSKIHSLTAFLLGISAGILGLQSGGGFLFYLLGTVVVSGLLHIFVVRGAQRGAGAGDYFPGNGEIVGIDENGMLAPAPTGSTIVTGGFASRKGAWRDIWFGGGVMGEALSGFVLGWAGVGGVLR
ncbi:hypothetical protein V8E54_006137 [Elaphomyces granulatus]|uniref:ER membrane protein complex subunit 6 n=1 Tax=Elaphomyces granulatus TaxID=519963 RepID=A0A232M3I1_9EURO|nr:hypothetical protein Egran_01385 [Elaphomyces granulatus]